MNRKQRRAGRKDGSPADARPGGEDPVALHALGVQAFRAGELQSAASLIARAIAIDSRTPSFHYNLAIVLKAQGRLEDAAASYQRALALKPDYAEAHNNLGNVWKALGRTGEARASFAQALRYNPASADTHYSLAVLCGELGERDAAARHLRDALASDPQDRNGAKILLAHLGLEDTPLRTSQAQLLGIYDVRSRFWDQERFYFGAALVAQALRRHATGSGLEILDIGCGTGLAGALVRELASRLDGVDISPAMLEKAKAKAVYDHLVQTEIEPFLSQHPGSCDAILAAATLIHFGDLAALFEAASRCLRGKGLFVFTVFPHDGDADYAVAQNYRLAQSGCFRHSRTYIKRLAAETGFHVLELETVTHEHDPDGKPVAGLLAVLQAVRP